MDDKNIIKTQQVTKVTEDEKSQLTSIANKVIELIRIKHS